MRGLNIRQYKEPDGEETPSFDFKKWVADTGKSEGFEEYAYLDSRGILTIGHGFNLQDPATRKKLQSRGYDVDGMIKGKVKMTEAQSLPLLEEIYKESFETAKTKFSNFDAFPESAKHVVTDMIYNMGESRFDGFKKFKAALEAGDFTQAGKEIADSSYAKQVKGRATKHIDRFKELSGDPDLSKFFPREEIPMVNAPIRELTSVSPSTPTPEVMPVRNTQEPVGYTEPPIDSTDTYVWTPSGKMSVTDFVNRYGEKVYESTFKSPVPKFATGGKVGPGDEKNKSVRSTERVAQTGEFEGFESSVYQDDYGNNTIGYGFNIDNPNIRKTLEKQGFDVQGMLEGRVQMTREEALPVLDLLYNDAYKNVTRRFPNFNTLNPDAQYVLVDMMYNLGTKKFDTFKKMQAAVKANDFKTAALEIEDSNYYRQTGNRAKAHVENMWQAGKTYEIQQKYKGITGQGLADLELQQLNQSTYAPVSTGVSLPPMKKHGGLTLSYWKDLDKQYYVNSDRTPREYKSGGWTDLDRRYGYYGQYPGYAYGSHVVHGGPTWPEYAMGLDSGATLHQTLNVLRGNPKPKILDTSAQGNMPKKAEYPSYYSQGVKKYSLPEEGRSLYGDGGSLTDEYRRVRSTIPRVSFDAPSKMYTGPTTQRGITFADGGPLEIDTTRPYAYVESPCGPGYVESTDANGNPICINPDIFNKFNSQRIDSERAAKAALAPPDSNPNGNPSVSWDVNRDGPYPKNWYNNGPEDDLTSTFMSDCPECEQNSRRLDRRYRRMMKKNNPQERVRNPIEIPEFTMPRLGIGQFFKNLVEKCRPGERCYKFEDGGWLDSYEKGGMIKRADGSYSRRGLWDNIRANRGSGKKPTKEMLKQERKIRAAEKKADGSFVGIEPMTNLNIPAPRYNKTPDKAVMPVVYANEPNTPDWSKGAKFADGGFLKQYEEGKLTTKQKREMQKRLEGLKPLDIKVPTSELEVDDRLLYATDAAGVLIPTFEPVNQSIIENNVPPAWWILDQNEKLKNSNYTYKFPRMMANGGNVNKSKNNWLDNL
jgi:lysozyme